MSRKEVLKQEKLRKLIISLSLVLAASIVIFVWLFYSYNKNLEKKVSESLDDFATINERDELESKVVETTILNDKTKDSVENSILDSNTVIENKKLTLNNTNKITENKVEEKNKVAEKSENVSKEEKIEETTNKEVKEVVSSNNIQNKNEENKTQEVASENNNTNNINNDVINNSIATEDTQIKFEFMIPVSGEIIKDYAEDTLLYSNTLEEWTTHLGVDIKAAKTTIVVAAESGIIEKINTDPRYGNSITIDHGNGFKTIYSSLLVSDFFEVGEKVEKGDTIGTVGETANFEMMDDCHLHFEMYKDGKCVNPTLYLK